VAAVTSPTPTTPATADDARYMRYVARQPILNADESVLGYELLFRDGVVDYFSSPDSDAASRSTLDASLLLGLDVLCDGRLAFINCTRDLLLNDITLLPPDRVVVEILETVPADEAVIAACRRLKKAGYMIALDDFVPGGPREPLTSLADIIKVDVKQSSLAQRAAISRQNGERCRLLAEKVETRAEFLATRKAGFTYFQGYFFRRPELMQAREIPANRVNYLRLLKAVSRAELDPRELENVIKGEASLCYRLLRYLNSPLFGFPAEIRSVRHALVMLGEREVRRWLRLATTLVASQSRSSDPGAGGSGARPLLRIAGAEPAARRSRLVSGGAAFADGRDSRHPHGPGVGGHLAGPGNHGGAAGTAAARTPRFTNSCWHKRRPNGRRWRNSPAGFACAEASSRSVTGKRCNGHAR